MVGVLSAGCKKSSEGTAFAVPKFFGWAGTQPSKLLFANRYSPFAVIFGLHNYMLAHEDGRRIESED